MKRPQVYALSILTLLPLGSFGKAGAIGSLHRSEEARKQELRQARARERALVCVAGRGAVVGAQ